MQKVVIDADFFRHTTDYESGTLLFEKLMRINKYAPVMHYYVSSVELVGNQKLHELIRSKKIEILRDSNFIDKDDKEYVGYFRQAYYKVNRLELGNEDVWTYGYDGKVFEQNLGEIRSIYLALKKGYDLLLSDDGDSKLLCGFVSSKKRRVKVSELYDLLVREYDTKELTWKDLKATVPKVFQRNLERLEFLRQMYVEGSEA